MKLTDELNTRLAQNGIIVISNGLPYIYDDDDAGSIITTIQVNTQSARLLEIVISSLHLIHGPKILLGFFLLSTGMAFVTQYLHCLNPIETTNILTLNAARSMPLRTTVTFYKEFNVYQ